ncbi:MAG: DUF1999 family protein [Deinococcales bacterium]
MACFARPLSEDDFEVLSPIDQAYALKWDLEPQLSRASLSFYLRTGHSFVAMRQGRAVAFVLAQAIWNGVRPTVWASYLAAEEDDQEACEAMLEAVVKSAYDSAVYDLEVSLPCEDMTGQLALEIKGFLLRPLKLYKRVLGSRAGGL